MSTDTRPGAESPEDAFAAQPFLREQLGLDGTRERSPGERRAPRLPVDIRSSLEAVRPEHGRFHGAKFSLGYFPAHEVFSSAADENTSCAGK